MREMIIRDIFDSKPLEEWVLAIRQSRQELEALAEEINITSEVGNTHISVIEGARVKTNEWYQALVEVNSIIANLQDSLGQLSPEEPLQAGYRATWEWWQYLQSQIPKTLESHEEVAEGTKKTWGSALSDFSYLMGQLGSYSKELAIASAIINTAEAITKTIAKYGATPMGLIQSAVAAAIGAAQIATITGTSIPKAEKGAYLPRPTLIEAGHGRYGEAIIPLERMPQIMNQITNNYNYGRPSKFYVNVRIGNSIVEDFVIDTIKKATNTGRLEIPAKAIN